MTNPSPRLLQLYSLRAQVEALIAGEESELMGSNSGCEHPEDRRIAANNMGEAPKFYCQDCKQFVQVRQ